MTGYRDDRETLLRRIEVLEGELEEARSDDVSAADDIASLRAERSRLKSALRHVDQAAEDAQMSRRQLESKVVELRRELEARPSGRVERVAWAGVAAALVLSLLAAMSMPMPLLVVAGVAVAVGFGLYAVSLRQVEEPPAGRPPKRAKKRANMRARVELEQRREDARRSSKRRARKHRRRRR